MADPVPIDMLNNGSGVTGMAAPDVYGAICGWRAFECVPTNLGMRLQSPHYTDHVWRRGEQPASTCLADACEGANCLCGYNAFTSQDLMDRSLDHTACPVVGEIEMWGEVREFDLGYRAQSVQIKRLIVREVACLRKGILPSRLAAELAEIYQVPVEIDRRLFTSQGAMTVMGRTLSMWDLVLVFIAAAIVSFALATYLA